MSKVVQKVLITGASGALGKAVIGQIRQQQDIDIITCGRSPDSGCSVVCDLGNRDSVAQMLQQVQPDLILHLAATFGNDLDEAFAINVQAARFLLDGVEATSAKATRVVLIGSAAEYGVVHPEENPVTPDRVLRPVSVYGMTKAWQTQLAGVYAARGVDVVVARVFNLDGPGMSERLFVGRLQAQIDHVMAGRAQQIELGPLSATRDYIMVDAAAEQILAIAAHAGRGEIHHVASGKPVTMRELMRQKMAAHGLDVAIVREAPELTNRSGYDVPVIYADIASTSKLTEMWRTGKHA